MTPGRRAITLGIEGAILLLVALLLVGSMLGQPVGLAFVETGSMAPTLEPGDGFVALPPPIAGEVETGDVITFNARYIQGGGLTTHRVVDVTEEGIVTSGDANPFTDQQAGERPVRREEVLAVALQVGDHLVTIPHLGTVRNAIRDGIQTIRQTLAIVLGSRAILGIRGVALLIFLTSVLAYAFDVVVGDPRTKSRHRTRRRSSGIPVGTILAIIVGAAILAATAAMTIPAGPMAIPFDAVDDPDRQGGIPVGETRPVTLTIENNGLVPITTILGDGGQYVSTRDAVASIPPRGSATTTVSVTAPTDPGRYRGYTIQHRYLGVLPTPLIVELYRLHPWLPIVAVDVFVGMTLFAAGRLVLGTGRRRIRTRTRNQSVLNGWL